MTITNRQYYAGQALSSLLMQYKVPVAPELLEGLASQAMEIGQAMVEAEKKMTQKMDGSAGLF